jgi:mxaL protein
LLTATFIMPQASVSRASYDVLAIVDVTGSMNVRDYAVSARPVSRLDTVKTALRDMMTTLPSLARRSRRLHRAPALFVVRAD